MNRLFWEHTEPAGVAGAVLGCRQFLASGQTLANADDAIHVARLLLVDGLQTYARYDGDFRPVDGRPSTVRLDLRAPRTARSREVLIDALSFHALLMRLRNASIRVPAEYTQIQPSLARVVRTRRFEPVSMMDRPIREVAPWLVPAAPGPVLPEAGLIPIVPLTGAAAVWTVIAVTGIVSALVGYIVSKVADSADNWQRSRAALDLNLTRQATSYAKLMQAHQDHVNREREAGKEIPYSAAESALMDSARRDLEAGRADARAMVDELVKPPAGGAQSTILLLGLAMVAAFAYTRRTAQRA